MIFIGIIQIVILVLILISLNFKIIRCGGNMPHTFFETWRLVRR